MRGLAILYAKNRAKKSREKETNIQKRLEELDNVISSLANTDHIIHQLETGYTTIKEEKLRAKLSPPKQDGLNKVKNQPNTFSIWKKRYYNRKVIKSLKRPDGEMICDELETVKEIELYYRNLYLSVLDKGNDLFEEFIGNMNYTLYKSIVLVLYIVNSPTVM